MKLIELYNQARLKEWIEYDLYIGVGGLELPVEVYSRDVDECRIVLRPKTLPRPRKKTS